MTEIGHHLPQQLMSDNFRVDQRAITVEDYQAHGNPGAGNGDSII
jgi:hypothetical protein